MYKIYDNCIGFLDGYYFYVDGKGNNSVISRQCANEEEESLQRYQADMDVGRGGMDPNRAYPGRGFVGQGYDWKYTRYETNDMSANKVVCPIAGRFVIPFQIGKYPINYIYDRAFCDCTELDEIMIPNYISSIGKEAFSGCTNLYYIKLTDRIVSIGAEAFEKTAYYNDPSNWSGPALYINNWLIKVNKEAKGEFTVADHVVGIADEAFSDCTELTKVILPETIDYIGKKAFSGCTNLREVVFPAKVSKFGSQVLENCPRLAVLELPVGLTEIDGLKGNTELTKIVIPEGVTTIGREAFRDCINLREIHLPKSLEQIESEAFENTGYANDATNWSENVLYLDNWILDSTDAFNGRYRIKDGTVGIADEAFTVGSYSGKGYESLTELEMPDSIQYIGIAAFEYCHNIEKLNLSKNLKHVSQSMLRGMDKLIEITIPYSVKSMNIWVFSDCSNLEKIVIENPNMEIEWPAICYCPKATVFCHKGSKVESYMIKYKIPYKEI